MHSQDVDGKALFSGQVCGEAVDAAALILRWFLALDYLWKSAPAFDNFGWICEPLDENRQH